MSYGHRTGLPSHASAPRGLGSLTKYFALAALGTLACWVLVFVQYRNGRSSAHDFPQTHQAALLSGLASADRRAEDGTYLAPSLQQQQDSAAAPSLSVCDVGFAVLTAPKYFDNRVVHLEASWLRRTQTCPKPNYVLVASQKHPRLPTLATECAEDYNNLCCKTLASLRHMYESWPEKQWYMKMDDDTLLAPKNLALELSALDASKPLLVGGQLYHSEVLNSRANVLPWHERATVQHSVRGGSGYLLSRPLAKLVVEAGDKYLALCGDESNKRFYTLEDAAMSELVRQLAGPEAIVQHPGMCFERPELAFRADYSRRNFRPLSFHMMHDTQAMPMYDFLLSGPLEDPHSPVTYAQLSKEATETRTSITQKLPELQTKQEETEETAQLGASLQPRADLGHPCASLLSNLTGQLTTYYKAAFDGIDEVAFIGLPDHPNRGDSAIFVGALILLDSLNVKIVDAIHLIKEYDPRTLTAKFTVPPERRALVFHGGGNFGDLYKHHHALRLQALSDFPSLPVIMFPQTVHFRGYDEETYSAMLESKDKSKNTTLPEGMRQTIQAFTNHKAKVRLAARDLVSEATLRRHFEGGVVEVTLLPDMAFMIGDQRHRRGLPLLDMLIHGRLDSEAPKLNFGRGFGTKRVADLQPWEVRRMVREIGANKIAKWNDTRPEQWFEYVTFAIDDWIQNDAVFPEGPTTWRDRMWARTYDGMAFLSRARVVVTNRLHGHILMTLLGMPHVMMGDAFGKLSKFRGTWTAQCPLSQWSTEFRTALVKALDVL